MTFADQSETFEHLGAFFGDAFNLTAAGEPVRLDGARVSAGFFPALGVAPQLGRMFRPDEDRQGHELEVILSDRLWRDHFGADPGVAGRTMNLNGASYTIIGVMPAAFDFPQSAGMPGSFTLPRSTALWVPLALSHGARVRGEPSELAVVGRLAPGITVDRAQSELDRFALRMEREFPQGKGWFNSRVTPMTRQLAGATQRPLFLLLGAVAVVLLIACVNVANLLLTRAITRTREFTLRAALGAGRARLVRQLATESLLLAVLAGGGGIGIATGGVAFAKAFGPADVARLGEARLDPSVLLFALVVSLATGTLFGVAPAWSAAGERLGLSLKDGGHRAGSSARGSRLRSALLVTEVALALVLIIASGLLVRSFKHLLAVDGGFNADRVLTFALTLPLRSYGDSDRIVGAYRAALQKLQALPGVTAVGIGETVPMGGAGESTRPSHSRSAGDRRSGAAVRELHHSVAGLSRGDWYADPPGQGFCPNRLRRVDARGDRQCRDGETVLAGTECHRQAGWPPDPPIQHDRHRHRRQREASLDSRGARTGNLRPVHAEAVAVDADDAGGGPDQHRTGVDDQRRPRRNSFGRS